MRKRVTIQGVPIREQGKRVSKPAGGNLPTGMATKIDILKAWPDTFVAGYIHDGCHKRVLKALVDLTTKDFMLRCEIVRC